MNRAVPPRRSGFTLLELVVVLAILGVVSLVAARGVSDRQNRVRRERSDRLLEEIRLAVCGDPLAREEDRGLCFVEDLGRLPQTVAWTHGGTVWQTPAELVVRPDGIPPYAAVALSPATVCAAGGASFDPAADAGVVFAAGWRGPYVRVPVGAVEPWLRDAWGAPFATAADAPANARRLSADGSFADAVDRMPVAFLRHLGADAEPDGGDWARGGPDDADAVVDLRRATSAVARCTASFSNAASVVFRLYVPCTCPVPRGQPVAHVLEATATLGAGDASADNAFSFVFTDVPRGRWMFTAHPEGETGRTHRKWVRAE